MRFKVGIVLVCVFVFANISFVIYTSSLYDKQIIQSSTLDDFDKVFTQNMIVDDSLNDIEKCDRVLELDMTAFLESWAVPLVPISHGECMDHVKDCNRQSTMLAWCVYNSWTLEKYG